MFQQMNEVEHFFKSRHPYGVKPGLGRIRKLLKLLGNPERNLQVVHIAGTNGKGSTLTFIKQVFIQHDYQVGTFVSPSLNGLCEHIYLNQSPIPPDQFVKIMDNIYPLINKLDQDGDQPTEFELLVAVMFVYFSNKTDIVIVEAGMGGLEDSTNCLSPMLTIITNIGKDHRLFLGDTIASIAQHKAGIIKKEIPLITGALQQEALDIVQKKVKENNTVLYQYGEDFQSVLSPNQSSFRFVSDQLAIPHIQLSMFGSHQVSNACIAIMALAQLKEMGWPIEIDKMKEGLREAQLPGRFESIHQNPRIILDGAHNVEGIKAFIQTVQQRFPNDKKHVLFAGFQDKPLQKMIVEMEGAFDRFTLTTFSHERAVSNNKLYQLAHNMNKSVELNWEKVIIDHIKEYHDKEDHVLFITGSLHFISVARAYILKMSDS
ncbi:bifunctional folylpolyglutamate synthase/dihydrofolate synthase [Terrihalobacillus insolitus]|uniref:bifunctional folylpolyglutamate synthase/dihydrofolate synthase n=1 Tax=Terrihalobacillus insolitus TaxID=2950438 RepID=UPI0023425802|nr:folylpolyglutamate synthase/dihydrofolate synthase family protein [Terrihalobacillus insolitus]MDC3412477.1 bifunctional folylpolyglutamate synthase/dihydrofolate synthase [Terrihalobacillus insolitus]